MKVEIVNCVFVEASAHVADREVVLMTRWSSTLFSSSLGRRRREALLRLSRHKMGGWPVTYQVVCWTLVDAIWSQVLPLKQWKVCVLSWAPGWGDETSAIDVCMCCVWTGCRTLSWWKFRILLSTSSVPEWSQLWVISTHKYIIILARCQLSELCLVTVRMLRWLLVAFNHCGWSSS